VGPHLCSTKFDSHLKSKPLKHLTAFLLAAFMLLNFIPTAVKANTVAVKNLPIAPADSTAATIVMARLTQIMHMDKKALSSTEKKALRTELRTIKNHKELSGGVYLSAGAVLLIVLLIIILL